MASKMETKTSDKKNDVGASSEESAKVNSNSNSDKKQQIVSDSHKSGNSSRNRMASVIGYSDRRMLYPKRTVRIAPPVSSLKNSGPQLPGGENNGVMYFGFDSENNSDEKVDKLLFGKLHLS